MTPQPFAPYARLFVTIAITLGIVALSGLVVIFSEIVRVYRKKGRASSGVESLPKGSSGGTTPEDDSATALSLAGELCAFLMANGHEVSPPPVYDTYAGLGDYPDDPEIRDSFTPLFGQRIYEIKRRIGNRGILDEPCRTSNVGAILSETSIRRAEDVREIIECLTLAARKIAQKYMHGKPFSFDGRECIYYNASILSPLQSRAIGLARELRIEAEKGKQGCSPQQFQSMRLDYEQKFAPRVKDIMFEFAREQGVEDSTLRRHVQFIDNGNCSASTTLSSERQLFLPTNDIYRRQFLTTSI